MSPNILQETVKQSQLSIKTKSWRVGCFFWESGLRPWRKHLWISGLPHSCLFDQRQTWGQAIAFPQILQFFLFEQKKSLFLFNIFELLCSANIRKAAGILKVASEAPKLSNWSWSGEVRSPESHSSWLQVRKVVQPKYTSAKKFGAERWQNFGVKKGFEEGIPESHSSRLHGRTGCQQGAWQIFRISSDILDVANI